MREASVTGEHGMLQAGPPPFFIVGAPKCGTTAWGHYLRSTPGVFMPLAKEVNHFATDLLRPGDPFRDPRKHADLFRGAGEGDVVGQASVYDLYSREAATNIAAFRADARIIIMVRDPVDLLHAYHAQLVYNGAEPISDFRRALEESRSRASHGDTRLVGMRDYFGVAALDEQAQRYLDVFGREAVHFVVFDDLAEDTQATFARTLDFLGLEHEAGGPLEPVNTGKAVRSAFLRNYLLNSPPRPLLAVGRVIPRPLRWRLRRLGMRANAVPATRDPIPADLRLELRERFAPVIGNLEDILERDLSGWQ